MEKANGLISIPEALLKLEDCMSSPTEKKSMILDLLVNDNINVRYPFNASCPAKTCQPLPVKTGLQILQTINSSQHKIFWIWSE